MLGWIQSPTTDSIEHGFIGRFFYYSRRFDVPDLEPDDGKQKSDQHIGDIKKKYGR